MSNLLLATHIEDRKLYEPLEVSGELFLERVYTTEPIEVRGEFKARASKLSALQIWGQSQLEACHLTAPFSLQGRLVASKVAFDEPVRVYGALWARSCQFKAPFTGFGQELVFEACQLKGLNIEANPSSPSKLSLKKGSTVDGDIVFEGHEGIVELHQGSQVKGKIIGATVKVY